MPDGRVWLALADPLTSKLFFTCGLVPGLRERLGGRFELVFLMSREQAAEWEEGARGIAVTYRDELFPTDVRVSEKVARRVDAELEEELGFWPLAIRFNERYAFHTERMARGHGNPFLDLDHRDPLPRWSWVESGIQRWYFSPRRYVPRALLAAMRERCDALVLASLQTPAVVPLVAGARRLGKPVVGYVASWDHPVGKGVISPYLDTYIVQNDVMRADLARYHGVDPGRVVVTGWPQSDSFFRHRPREEYDVLLRRLGLDPALPVVLVMGNTPTNTPYEPAFFARLLGWWESSGANARFSLLFRPHPRDRQWQERFAAVSGRRGAAVEPLPEASIETLATMFAYGSCVVSNAGTIVLDALVNDRPAVCVLYDEGAPAGESWATLNVLGAHYRELMASTAFYRAQTFDEVVESIERALAHPEELAAERKRVAHEVVGELDGHAADRVCDAILRATTPR